MTVDIAGVANWLFVGLFQYGDGATAVLDDLALARIAALLNFARSNGEAFFVTYGDDVDGRPGRTSVWLHPAVVLRIVYDFAPAAISDGEVAALVAVATEFGEVAV